MPPQRTTDCLEICIIHSGRNLGYTGLCERDHEQREKRWVGPFYLFRGGKRKTGEGERG